VRELAVFGTRVEQGGVVEGGGKLGFPEVGVDDVAELAGEEGADAGCEILGGGCVHSACVSILEMREFFCDVVERRVGNVMR